MMNIRNKQRPFRLLKYLYENTDEDHAVSTPELVKIFQAEDAHANRKTIKDDIDVLVGEGFDVVTVRSKNHSFFLGARKFEIPEIKLLIDAVSASRFITADKSVALIDKLTSMVSKMQAEKVRRHMYSADHVKSDNWQIYYIVDAITDAINEGKKIRFQYFDWNLKKEMEPRYGGRWYQLSPWALMWDDENYYLVAYDSKHEVIIHYRVDKMTQIRVLDEKREGHEEFRQFNIAHYTNTLFGMYAGDETKVTLEAENRLVSVFIDRFGKDIIIAPVDEDHFRTTVTVAVSKQFFGWIMAIDGDVKIVAPDSVVKQMKAEIERLAEKYK